MTPETFDKMVRPSPPRPEKLWGAVAIGKALGLSPDTIATLARKPETPIYMPGGRYFAFRSELERWLRSKPAA